MGYLGQRLKEPGLPADFAAVELGMRYGNPAIADGARPAAAAGCDRILVVPLFPAILGERHRVGARRGVRARAARCAGCPALRTIDCFHDDPGYIRALARNVNDYWMKQRPRPTGSS